MDASALARSLASRTATFGPHSGALVRDLSTGLTIYARRPDLQLSPASNEKLYTTAAALLRFGVSGHLTTTLRNDPSVVPDADGVLHGDVVLVGTGDPGLNDVTLRDLVGDVQRAGITRIVGRILGDESAFDKRRGSYETHWAPDEWLGGWLSALTWGHGRAGAHGPAQTAAARLRYLLGLQHIKVTKTARAGTDPATTHVLGSVASPAMSQIVATTLVPSDNFYAETLIKDLGAHYGTAGSTPAGLVVARKVLGDRLGVHPTMVDGSGLSPADQTSTTQIVTLLTAMRARPEGASWRDAMPQPGRTGTLANRMRGTLAVTRCRAKTGTLHDVSALSGYCRVGQGHTVAFSFLENGITPTTVKAVEDKMVPLIAAYEPPLSSPSGR